MMRIDSLTSWMRSGMNRRGQCLQYGTIYRPVDRLGAGAGMCSEYLGARWGMCVHELSALAGMHGTSIYLPMDLCHVECIYQVLSFERLTLLLGVDRHLLHSYSTRAS